MTPVPKRNREASEAKTSGAVVQGAGSSCWLELRCRMRRRRINRDFTKPEAIQPLIFFPSSFEQVVKALNISPEEYESSLELKEWVRHNQVVKALNISPEEYESSLELKEWVRHNKDHKYVPTGLLEAFGFHVNTEP